MDGGDVEMIDVWIPPQSATPLTTVEITPMKHTRSANQQVSCFNTIFFRQLSLTLQTAKKNSSSSLILVYRIESGNWFFSVFLRKLWTRNPCVRRRPFETEEKWQLIDPKHSL